MKLKWMFFWNSLAFSMRQQMLAIWSLVLLTLRNPACTPGSSWSVHCWSLAWRILSITLLAYEMSPIVPQFEILWHCPSLGLEWKLTFSNPVATAEFSKFAGILSTALQQHYLLGFETGIPPPPLALSVVKLPKDHLTWHLGCLALGEWSDHPGYPGH